MLSIERRPRKFEEFLGQKRTVTELQTLAREEAFPQVMFFTGPSGTGKTSMAYVVAALLNGNSVENPDLDDPAVRDIFSERFARDVKFYDASTMGKADILALQEEVSYSPVHDANKIFIIDEAQELSRAGKGATLTLLEKKIPGVYLVLCTMNPEVFDRSVLSRGQVYKFRSPAEADLSEYLFSVLEQELSDEVFDSIPEEFFEEGIFTLASAAEGNIRSALQNLERCINGKLWTRDIIIEELGIIDNASVVRTLELLLQGEPTALEYLDKVDLKEFFYKSKTILENAQRVGLGLKLSAEWQQRSAESLFNRYEHQIAKLLKEVYLPALTAREITAIFKMRSLLWVQELHTTPILETREEKPTTPKRRRRPVT